MNSTPSISFIICNFNGRSYLEALFASLRALAYPKELIEIIVVDNGSQDDSVEFIRTDAPEAKLIRNAENLGFARACDQGAEAAGSEWLAFVNNDMRLEPDWLARFFEALSAAGSEVVCAGGKILSWDGSRIDFIGGAMSFTGHAFQPHFGEEAAASSMKAGGETLFACGGSMLIRRDVFLEVGGFDEDYFAYFEDVDFGWRLWLMGYRVIFVPGAIAYHHHFGTTRKFAESRHLFLCERNALYTIYKNYSETSLGKILPAALMLLMQKFFLYTSFDPSDFLMGISPQIRGDEGTGAKEAQASSVSRLIGLAGDIGIKETLDRAALALAIRKLGKEGMHAVSEKGMAVLSAVPAFMRAWDQLAKKRDRVQKHRKRSDEEIFPLFKDPLWIQFEEPAYKESFDRIISLFRLSEIFCKATEDPI